MLLKYEIENFKAIGDRQRIPLKPITLLYGANSSGKSSILQTLLLQKQTLEESKDDNIALLPVGGLVDLGMFKDFIYNHDITNTLEFRYTFKKPESIIDEYCDLDEEIKNRIETEDADQLLNLLDCKTISAVIKFSCNKKDMRAVVSGIDLYLGDESKPLVYFEEVANSSSRLKVNAINSSNNFWNSWKQRQSDFLDKNTDIFAGIFEKWSKGEQMAFLKKLQAQIEERKEKKIEIEKNGSGAKNLKNLCEKRDPALSKFENDFLGLNNFLPELLNGSDINDILKSYYYGNNDDISNPSLILLIISYELRNYFRNMIYIGPLREHPERIYRRLGYLPLSVGIKGDHFQEFIAVSEKDRKLMNERLKAFGINYTILLNNYIQQDTKGSKASDIFAIELLDDQNETISNIRDVGFGISQVLPIIVQSIMAKHKTLAIEQPELHLHPALQAELGSLFAESIKSPYNNRFIIETHSEHLMLRIQKLIRKDELTPEEVSVIYVDKEKDGAKCLELRLDKEGDFIDEWPHGFFEEGYKEIFGDK